MWYAFIICTLKKSEDPVSSTSYLWCHSRESLTLQQASILFSALLCFFFPFCLWIIIISNTWFVPVFHTDNAIWLKTNVVFDRLWSPLLHSSRTPKSSILVCLQAVKQLHIGYCQKTSCDLLCSSYNDHLNAFLRWYGFALCSYMNITCFVHLNKSSHHTVKSSSSSSCTFAYTWLFYNPVSFLTWNIHISLSDPLFKHILVSFSSLWNKQTETEICKLLDGFFQGYRLKDNTQSLLYTSLASLSIPLMSWWAFKTLHHLFCLHFDSWWQNAGARLCTTWVSI